MEPRAAFAWQRALVALTTCLLLVAACTDDGTERTGTRAPSRCGEIGATGELRWEPADGPNGATQLGSVADDRVLLATGPITFVGRTGDDLVCSSRIVPRPGAATCAGTYELCVRLDAESEFVGGARNEVVTGGSAVSLGAGDDRAVVIHDGATVDCGPGDDTVRHGSDAPAATTDCEEVGPLDENDLTSDEFVGCDEIRPDDFDPLEVRDGSIVIADPRSRPGVGSSGREWTADSGELLPGVGCAFIETYSRTISVSVTWSGNYGVTAPDSRHVEGAPLLYVDPDTRRFGFGVWPSELYDVPVLLVGYIGGPPEEFEPFDSAFLPGGHVDGTPREIELRAREPGLVTLWVDGRQIPTRGHGYEPIVIDPGLATSTKHGIALDAHYVADLDLVPTIPGIDEFRISLP